MSHQEKCRNCHTLLGFTSHSRSRLCEKCERKARGLPEVPKFDSERLSFSDDEYALPEPTLIRAQAGVILWPYLRTSIQLGRGSVSKGTRIANAEREAGLQERWYSPWKRCLRSAFGIVHAVVSFSLLVTYFDRLERGASDPAVQEFARQRRLAEARRLALVRPAALECISQVQDLTLRTFLGALLDHALEAGAAAGTPTT